MLKHIKKKMCQNREVKNLVIKIYRLAVLASFAIVSTKLSAAEYAHYFSSSLGMINMSFQEGETPISSLDPDEDEIIPRLQDSGTSSVLSMELSYHVPISAKMDYFGKLVLPIQLSSGDSYVYGGGGMNYFFGGLSSELSAENQTVRIRMTPRLRYYAGGQVGLGYLVYLTETAKKTDMVLDVSAHGGGIYSFRGRWGIKGEVGYGMGFGTNISTTGLRIFVGSTYTF